MTGRLDPTLAVLKQLFALSLNQCEFFRDEQATPLRRRCEKPLYRRRWRAVKAQVAHIYAEREGGARFRADLTPDQRRAFDNLMLVCPDHHLHIDVLEPDRYPAEILIRMKGQAEAAGERQDRPDAWDDRLLSALSMSLLEVGRMVRGDSEAVTPITELLDSMRAAPATGRAHVEHEWAIAATGEASQPSALTPAATATSQAERRSIATAGVSGELRLHETEEALAAEGSVGGVPAPPSVVVNGAIGSATAYGMPGAVASGRETASEVAQAPAQDIKLRPDNVTRGHTVEAPIVLQDATVRPATIRAGMHMPAPTVTGTTPDGADSSPKAAGG